MSVSQTETQFGNPYRFTGRRKDYEESSPFYYYRTRYYNPESGRFISHDSIGDWGDPLEKGNGLAYCGNNPVNCTDPMGMDGTGVKAPPAPKPKKPQADTSTKPVKKLGFWRKFTLIRRYAALCGGSDEAMIVGLFGLQMWARMMEAEAKERREEAFEAEYIEWAEAVGKLKTPPETKKKKKKRKKRKFYVTVKFKKRIPTDGPHCGVGVTADEIEIVTHGGLVPADRIDNPHGAPSTVQYFPGFFVWDKKNKRVQVYIFETDRERAKIAQEFQHAEVKRTKANSDTYSDDNTCVTHTLTVLRLAGVVQAQEIEGVHTVEEMEKLLQKIKKGPFGRNLKFPR